jgi:hypothetical protein
VPQRAQAEALRARMRRRNTSASDPASWPP